MKSFQIKRFSNLLLLVDLFGIFLTLLVLEVFRFGIRSEFFFIHFRGQDLRFSYFVAMGISIPIWLLILGLVGSRNDLIIGVGTREYSLVSLATVYFFALQAIVMFALNASFSRFFFFFGIPLGIFILILCRWLMRKILRIARSRGDFQFRTLLLGDKESISQIKQKLLAHPAAGYLPIAGAEIERYFGPLVSSRSKPLSDLINRKNIQAIILAKNALTDDSIFQSIVWSLEGSNVRLLLAPGLHDVISQRIQTIPVASQTLLSISIPGLTSTQKTIKRLIDFSISLLGIIMLFPVFLITAILIKLDDLGPIFYMQKRVGYKGKYFKIYKFRSMKVNADSELIHIDKDQDAGNSILFKMKTDPRVTLIGRFLRRWSIDELPQLFNVLLGNMSLVGPRPPLPIEVEQYEEHVNRKFLVKPGITGLWQISGRSDLSWDDSVKLDLYYVDNWTIAGDISIIFQTAKAVLQSKGAY